MSDKRYKVSEKQIAALRVEYAGGKTTLHELARKYSISHNYVWKLVHGLSQKRRSPITCPHCHETI